MSQSTAQIFPSQESVRPNHIPASALKANSSIDQNPRTAILFHRQNHAFVDIDVPRLFETKANTIVGFSDDDSPQPNPRLIQLVLKYSF